MTNMTISIPSELCEKMKKHAEVKWSEVVRKSIADYINKMEIAQGGVVPSSILSSHAQRLQSRDIRYYPR